MKIFTSVYDCDDRERVTGPLPGIDVQPQTARVRLEVLALPIGAPSAAGCRYEISGHVTFWEHGGTKWHAAAARYFQGFMHDQDSVERHVQAMAGDLEVEWMTFRADCWND